MAEAMGRQAAARRRSDEERARRRRSLPFVYWGWFVLMLVATLVVSLLIMRVLFSLHVLIAPGPVLLLGSFSVASIATGAVFALVFTRRFTRPILEMSDAAGRVAAGDFDIELHEKTFAVEIEQLAESFTDMTRELARVEMLSEDFVHNVSHEMKTPLAAIEGYASLLQERDISDETRRTCAERIQRSAQRLARLTDNVLALSRLEQAEQPPSMQRVDVAEQLREAVLAFENARGASSRTFDMQLDEEATCTGNAELLDAVWRNVIGNALKFTDEGGHIRVSLARAQDGGIVVEVEDDGIGMDEQQLARAFEKFYQADRSHAGEGNGLGLALARRIVDVHGGHMSAASAPGVGTTVTVHLP